MEGQLTIKLTDSRASVTKAREIMQDHFYVLKVRQLKTNIGMAQRGFHIFIDALLVPQANESTVQLGGD